MRSCSLTIREMPSLQGSCVPSATTACKSVKLMYASILCLNWLSVLQLFSYVMSVLYPECLIRIIMDFYSISFEQVTLFLSY